MKLIRIAALGAVLLAAAAASSFAQGGGGGGGRNMSAALLRGITLDAAVQAKVDSIVAKYRAEMPAYTPGAPPDSAARAKRMELQTKQSADIRALLNADQQKLFDQNLDEIRNRQKRPQH